MQMTLDSNTGCYEMADVNMYYLYPMSGRGGGAKFQCADFEGEGKFSARRCRGGAGFQWARISEFLHPPPPRYRSLTPKSLLGKPVLLRPVTFAAVASKYIIC